MRNRYCRASLRSLVLSSLFLASSSAVGDVFPDPSIPEASDNGLNRSHGRKNALYFFIRNETAAPISTSRIDLIRSRENALRNYLAENSGGAFDMYYDQILDIPMALDSENRRPNNWLALAESYATNNYGVNLSSYYSHIFDVSSTTADEGQTWSGLYYGGQDSGRDLALQSSTSGTLIHEVGHRAGADHASAWRPITNATYSSYEWDANSGTYVDYVPEISPHNPMPFGVLRDEYGNPFDSMGNISDGNIRVREKVSDLGWLTENEVPDLANLGAGTYRIYAHDELQATTDINGNRGVTEGYRDDVFYGLSFTRTAQQLDTTGEDAGTWDDYSQRIDLEYRAGDDGVLFYLDGISSSDNSVLLDMDPEGGLNRSSSERALEVGSAVEDITFGMSTYYVTDSSDPDFLSFNPVAPIDPMVLRDEWYHINVLETNVDAIGSYVELAISVVSPLNGILADLNQDTLVNLDDFELFKAGWHTDTSVLTATLKYFNGDINLDGFTDIRDALTMREELIANGFSLSELAFFGAQVPEPSSLALLTCMAVLAGVRRRQPLR